MLLAGSDGFFASQDCFVASSRVHLKVPFKVKKEDNHFVRQCATFCVWECMGQPRETCVGLKEHLLLPEEKSGPSASRKAVPKDAQKAHGRPLPLPFTIIQKCEVALESPDPGRSPIAETVMARFFRLGRVPNGPGPLERTKGISRDSFLRVPEPPPDHVPVGACSSGMGVWARPVEDCRLRGEAQCQTQPWAGLSRLL